MPRKTWTREERYCVLRDAEEIRTMHERIAASDYRQAYHIQPVTGLLNDGDAVFSSRIFPAAGEERLLVKGDASLHLWELKRAVEDDFAVE